VKLQAISWHKASITTSAETIRTKEQPKHVRNSSLKHFETELDVAQITAATGP